MAGYYKHSMSNNAVDAYESGQMPESKWTKQAMMSAIRQAREDYPKALNKLTRDMLFQKLFCSAGWHHTSKMYNETFFYELDTDVLDELSEEEAAQWLEEQKQIRQLKKEAKEKEASQPECYVIASYDEKVGGTSRRPKFGTFVGAGMIKKNYFYPLEGSLLPSKKKLVSGYYFNILKENLSLEQAEAFEEEQKEKVRVLEEIIKSTISSKKGLKKGEYEAIEITYEMIPKGDLESSEHKRYMTYCSKKRYRLLKEK